MNLAETAVLAVQLKLEDQLSGGVARAESEVAGLNTTVKASSGHLTNLARAATVAQGGVVKFGGALGHAKSQLVSLATGPLGLVGLGAGLFTLGGLFEKSVGRAQDFGMEVSKLSKLTGLSVETTSALAAALEHFGIGSDAALRSVGFLEKNVGLLASRKNGIVDFEKSFGLALTDANGHLKDANALVLASADYFNNKSIPATTKAAALAKLYGRSWQQLIPFLSAGSKGIRDAEEAAASLGLTLTKTNVQDLAKFKEATRELGTAVGGLELQIGLALVPAMKDLATAATAFVRDNREGIVSFFKQAISVGRDFAGFVTTSLLPAFRSVAGAAVSFWDSIPGPLKDLLVKGYVTNRVVKFVFGVDVVGDIAGALGRGIEGALGKAVGNGLVSAGLGKLFVQPVFVTNPGFGGGLPNVVADVAGGAAGLGAAGIAAIIAIPTAIFGLGQFIHDAFAWNPGHPLPVTDVRGSATNTPFGRTAPMGLPSKMIADAVALGTERGLVHSGVFAKAQAVRDAGGFRLSRDALIAQLHDPKKPLGTDTLVTAEAIALAAVNHLRLDKNPDLKSAAANLALLKRAEDKLPADLAGKLAPKIHSLEVAINGVTAAIKAKQFVATVQNYREGPNGPITPKTPLPNPKVYADPNSPGHHLAIGGPVRRGHTYLVGERGPELFSPKHDGTIIPNNKLKLTDRGPLDWLGEMFFGKGPNLGGEPWDANVYARTGISKGDWLAGRRPGLTGGYHHMAEGGRVLARRRYLVGEKGPELFSSKSDPGPIQALLDWLFGSAAEQAQTRANQWDPTSGISKGDWAHGLRRPTSGNLGRSAPMTIHANVNVSTRDVNTAQNIKRRYGPTYTQAGAG